MVLHQLQNKQNFDRMQVFRAVNFDRMQVFCAVNFDRMQVFCATNFDRMQVFGLSISIVNFSLAGFGAAMCPYKRITDYEKNILYIRLYSLFRIAER